MYLPSKGGNAEAIHGFPMWFTYLAILFASANLISIVVDHYDQRDNEINYKKFAAITSKLGGFCIGMSILLIFLFILTGKVI
jgi:Na+-transporting methylmalonyl-CoA/oxaloacetate decarboxylase gamma subunit